MPTDVALSTNTPSAALVLKQALPMPDGSGYAAFLVVRAGPFAAALPFLATSDAWLEFVRALERVPAGDGAPARLRAREGDDFVAIAGAGEGLLAVSGSLHDPDDDQALRFRFTAPVQGLAAFLSGVRRVMET